MTTHDSTTASFPDATPDGEHLVVDKTEWIPGRHPDKHRRWDGQQAYRDRYVRCIRCGAERTCRADLPATCEPEVPEAGTGESETADSDPTEPTADD